jgi:hypothetical protein
MANRFLTTGSVKRIEQRGVELEDGLGAPETVPVGSDGTEIAGVLGEVQANPTANTLLGRLKALETAFATLLAKLSTDPLPAGDNNIGNVDVVTMPNVIVGSSALPTGAATSAKQDALAALVGSVSDAAVTDPTLSGSEIALLKGLLKQMQGNGTGTLPVNVSGGVVISGDTTLAGTVLMRDATDPAKLAKVDANGNQLVTVSGSDFTELASNVNIITSKWKQAQEYDIYGVKWDKGAGPTLNRTDDAVGLTANAGVGYASVVNDFDKLPIFGEIEQVEDSLGNVFMKVPKFYCRDTDGTSHKQMQVSKRRYPGFYLPCLFWDFTNNKELDYVLVGKHKASLGSGNKLESKPNKYPLVNTNIVDFRTYAKNNNVDGLTGYQQNDIHWVDLLRKLMIIEFATLDIQTVMKGYIEGQYATTHLATVTETGVNRIIVANAHADLYRVGQSISVGTSQGGNQIFYGRTITSIDVYGASNKAITFDGNPVNITTGNILYNSGWKTGFSNQLLASSGSIVANDGKYPCVYRGIESPFGDVWEWVDGLNINDHRAWICKNADDYASNLFASPYEPLGYANHNANGYIKEMGFDPNYPFAQLPTAITGSTTPTQYYGDYYYQNAGQRVALFGGYWNNRSYAGLSYWNLSNFSSSTGVYAGGRLLKKPL